MVKYYGMTVGWALYTVLLPVRMEPAGGISIASEMYSDLPWKTVWILGMDYWGLCLTYVGPCCIIECCDGWNS